MEYSLRALPLGGFVAFPNADDPETGFAKDDPDLLENRPVIDRVLVTSAGAPPARELPAVLQVGALAVVQFGATAPVSCCALLPGRFPVTSEPDTSRFSGRGISVEAPCKAAFHPGPGAGNSTWRVQASSST